MAPSLFLFAALALQTPLDIFTNPATAWIIIPIMIFAIPLTQIIMSPITARTKALERDKLRQMYERLALEKLDVIKTAVAMGYKQNDLAELDSQLEKVIGSDAMQRVLEGKSLDKSMKALDLERANITIGISAGSKNKSLDTGS